MQAAGNTNYLTEGQQGQATAAAGGAVVVGIVGAAGEVHQLLYLITSATECWTYLRRPCVCVCVRGRGEGGGEWAGGGLCIRSSVPQT